MHLCRAGSPDFALQYLLREISVFILGIKKNESEKMYLLEFLEEMKAFPWKQWILKRTHYGRFLNLIWESRKLSPKNVSVRIFRGDERFSGKQGIFKITQYVEMGPKAASTISITGDFWSYFPE